MIRQENKQINYKKTRKQPTNWSPSNASPQKEEHPSGRKR
jgi:hypothetical protein